MRFIASDVYLGSIHLPKDDLVDCFCPICGEPISREHILSEWNGLSIERTILFVGCPQTGNLDMQWLVKHNIPQLTKFLLAIEARFLAAGVMVVSCPLTYSRSYEE